MLTCCFFCCYGLTPVIADYMCSCSLFYDQMHIIFLVRTPVRTSHNSPSILEGVAAGRGSNIKNYNTL